MRTLTCLVICWAEAAWLYTLIRRHSPDGDIDVFISNAPLDEVLRARGHSVMAFLALTLASMMRLT